MSFTEALTPAELALVEDLKANVASLVKVRAPVRPLRDCAP
jgi:hypothetical protein